MPYGKHFIFFVTYEYAQKARVFVPDRLFQPSLIMPEFIQVGYFQCSWPYPQTLD